MKQINNIKSEVFLSTYDNSDLLLPVTEEYINLKNVCVAVKFGDTVVKISPKDTCKCSWHEAMERRKDKLMNSAYWQMVGSVYNEVNLAMEMLGQELLDWVWTDTEDNDLKYSGFHAWYYSGTLGRMVAYRKSLSISVRATKVFKINE